MNHYSKSPYKIIITISKITSYNKEYTNLKI